MIKEKRPADIFNTIQNNDQIEHIVQKPTETTSKKSFYIIENSNKSLVSIQNRKHENNNELSEDLSEKYRLIATHTSDLIVFTTFDVNPIFKFVSPSHKKLLGYDEKDLLGKPGLDFIHENDKERITAILLTYNDAKINGTITPELLENAQKLDFRFRDKSGHFHFLQSTVDIINDELLFISKDITEQKQTEKALYRSEKKYRQLFENLNQGIWVLDDNAFTTYLNSFMAQLIGYTPEEMIGKCLYDFMDDIWKKIAKEKLKHVLDHIDKEYEFEFLKKNKTRIYTSIHMSPLFDKDGTYRGVIVSVQDISERKRMEHELHDKLDKLQKNELATLNIMEDLHNTINALTVAETQIREKNQALEKINSELSYAREELTILNRDLEKKIKERTDDVEKLLKQKDEFIDQLGHDLKTPLTPLIILLPIIKEREKDPHLKELLEVISNNLYYMKNLVIKTLTLAQLNSPNTQLLLHELDLSKQIRNILDMNKPLFEGKNVIIENNIPDETIVLADLIQIKELFDNLISNAVKYSQENNVKITLDAKKLDDFIVVSIKDAGIGLEPQQIQHVFDEFYKADYSRHDLKSTGLGLSICKRIVEKHGGHIWVESLGKGKGSTFCFTLKTPIDKLE
jgi:PAS domain S-box-containing protein